MIPFVKVLHIKDGITTNLNPYLLDLSIVKVSEAKKNNVSFNLKNSNGALNDIDFERDESSIKVYLDWSPITTQDPILVGNIDSISYTDDNKGKSKVKIKALDKTGLFLSKLWSFAYTDETPNPYNSGNGLKPHEAIRHVIDSSQDDLEASEQITYNNLSTVKADGTAFTTNVSVAKTWKPLYEWINEFSTVEYTDEDRGYVYHLDEDNDLHWGYPYQKVETILTSDMSSVVTTASVVSTSSYADTGTILIENEQITYTGKTSTTFTGLTRGANGSVATTHLTGDSVSGQKVQTGQDSVFKMAVDTDGEGEYNMVIYNAGNTPAGYDYLWYELDKSEIGKQIKMKFYDWKDISLSMFNAEKSWTDPVTSYGWDGGDSYPTPNSAALSSGNPWHPSWDTSLSIESDSDYQDEFIAHILKKGLVKAEAFFRTGRSKFNGSFSIKGTHNYMVNDLITIYSVPHETTKRLRVKEVRHIYTSTGWSTAISLESDEDVTSS